MKKPESLVQGNFHIAIIDALSRLDGALAAERIKADEK